MEVERQIFGQISVYPKALSLLSIFILVVISTSLLVGCFSDDSHSNTSLVDTKDDQTKCIAENMDCAP